MLVVLTYHDNVREIIVNTEKSSVIHKIFIENSCFYFLCAPSSSAHVFFFVILPLHPKINLTLPKSVIVFKRFLFISCISTALKTVKNTFPLHIKNKSSSNTFFLTCSFILFCCAYISWTMITNIWSCPCLAMSRDACIKGNFPGLFLTIIEAF